MQPRRHLNPLALCVVLLPAFVPVATAAEPPEDSPAIRDVLERYRVSWLANDPEQVLRTFAADAVLLPAGGTAPVVGRDAIRSFWWPAGGPATTITHFDQPVEQISGRQGLASAYGTSRVEWTTAGDADDPKTQSSRSQWSAILEKGSDGVWRIRALAWAQVP